MAKNVVSFPFPYRGRMYPMEVRQTLDVRDFLGAPWYPLMLLAANKHLSVNVLLAYLEEQAKTTPGVMRTVAWMNRRRWLFALPGEKFFKGRIADTDHSAKRALNIMRSQPTYSTRELVELLKAHGIKRGREWVRQHRVCG